jgi:hypothetical protein
VHAGSVTIAVRETRRELYIPCMMTSNNTEWERGCFYLRNDEPGLPPWTGKVVKEKADSWWHGLLPSSHQDWLDSALKALKALADAGLTAASVLANLHHRRIVPLMERRLRIFEMKETADPVALAQSRLMPDLLPQEYAATRARCAVNLRAIRVDDTALWAFTMLPEGPLVSRVPTLLRSFNSRSIVAIWSFTRPLKVRAVNAARSDPPTPRARARGATVRARAGSAQEGEEDPVTRAPGTEERGVPVARAAGALLPWDFGVLVVGRGGGGERWGTGSPREVGAFAPLAQSRGGGGRDSTWGGRESACRQAACEGGDARHGSAGARRGDGWGCGGNHASGGNNVCRAPEEEKTRVFHPEVGDCFLTTASFRSVRA